MQRECRRASNEFFRMSITGRDLFDAADKKQSDETLDLKSVELLEGTRKFGILHVVCSRPKYQISITFDLFLALFRIDEGSELFPLPKKFFSNCSTQVKALEAVLAGALRREQGAEYKAKQQIDEVEKANKLVSSQPKSGIFAEISLGFIFLSNFSLWRLLLNLNSCNNIFLA